MMIILSHSNKIIFKIHKKKSRLILDVSFCIPYILYKPFTHLDEHIHLILFWQFDTTQP